MIDSGHKTVEQWLRTGKLDAAEQLATELVSAAESLLQTDGSHQGHKWRLSTSLQLLGDVLLLRKHPDEARRKFQRALELQESLRAQSPESSRHRDRAVLILERLGDAAQQGSFREQALPHWNEALSMLDEMAKIDPSATDVPLLMVRLYRKRGTLLSELGQTAAARTDWQKALGLADGLLVTDRSDAVAQKERAVIDQLIRAAFGVVGR